MNTLELTPAEISHLLALLAYNQREGSYFPPKDQYWKRHERIKSKLMALGGKSDL
jgi:hypothetical protein